MIGGAAIGVRNTRLRDGQPSWSSATASRSPIYLVLRHINAKSEMNIAHDIDRLAGWVAVAHSRRSAPTGHRSGYARALPCLGLDRGTRGSGGRFWPTR